MTLTKLIITSVIALCISAALYTSVSNMVTDIKDKQATWNTENKCINGLISTGVERISIVRDNGSCKIL